LIERFQTLKNEDAAYFLDTLIQDKQVGEMSFPNFSGNFREYDHVDVVALARLAETAAVDLRIVLLARSPAQMLVSTTQHRHFDTPNREAAREATNAAALGAALSLIDPRFVRCLPWQADLDAWVGVAQWLHPAVQRDVVRRALKKADVVVAAANNGSFFVKKSPASPSPFLNNASEFALRRDPALAHLQPPVDVLYRTASCPPLE